MYQLGVIATISSALGAISFIAVILFIECFEYITEILDELQDEYYATYQMVQAVYKELMIMGFMAFAITMIETNPGVHTDVASAWIIAIDFAHVVLFFTALFYVAHAVFLIILSVYLSKLYRKLHKTSTKEMDLNQDIIQFKLQYYVFRESYKIDSTFNYALYLEYCTEKYILKLLSAGMFHRIVLSIIVIFNLIRLEILFSTDVSNECLSSAKNNFISRRLASSSGLEFNQICIEIMLDTFSIAGYIIVLALIVLFLFSKIYEWK